MSQFRRFTLIRHFDFFATISFKFVPKDNFQRMCIDIFSNFHFLKSLTNHFSHKCPKTTNYIFFLYAPVHNSGFLVQKSKKQVGTENLIGIRKGYSRITCHHFKIYFVRPCSKFEVSCTMIPRTVSTLGFRHVNHIFAYCSVKT